MTSLQEQIAKAILAVLADPEGADGGLLAEAFLYGAVADRTTPHATLDEFEDMLKVCEKKRWVTSQRGALGKMRWAITDEGRVARRAL